MATRTSSSVKPCETSRRGAAARHEEVVTMDLMASILLSARRRDNHPRCRRSFAGSR